jgi:hypothetical protein
LPPQAILVSDWLISKKYSPLKGELIKVCLTIELKLFLQTILFIYEYLIVRNNSFTQFELEIYYSIFSL